MSDMLFRWLLRNPPTDTHSRAWYMTMKRLYYQSMQAERPDLPGWLFRG